MEQKQLIKDLKDCFGYIRLLIKQKDKDGAKRVLSDADNILYKQMIFCPQVLKLETTFNNLTERVEQMR